MSNYASIGVDALVTLNMHRRRFAMPRVMSGRLMNKILFFTYGTKDVLERGCKHLSRYVSIRLDDGPKLGDDGDEPLPDLEGIVILNIPSWGAGVRLYELGYRPDEHPPQAMDDGKLEVLGLYSSFHIAQLQVRWYQGSLREAETTLYLRFRLACQNHIESDKPIKSRLRFTALVFSCRCKSMGSLGLKGQLRLRLLGTVRLGCWQLVVVRR